MEKVFLQPAHFPEWFQSILAKVEATDMAAEMKTTVENSPWHREANVWVHTMMTLGHYFEHIAPGRSKRQQWLTALALLGHDFGKPEAEETLEKKDEPGVYYRRYAGHEPISGAEFLNFICDHHDIRELFFSFGFGWNDIRTIKFMIENHLPYGLKNPQKREGLRTAIRQHLGADEVCFFDMLQSDARGRISDGHEEKLQNVAIWIADFLEVPIKVNVAKGKGQMIVLVGISGAGKSTWTRKFRQSFPDFTVFSEDELRLEYYESVLEADALHEWKMKPAPEAYDEAWKFCHLNKESQYDKFANERYAQLLASGRDFILDRMNQGRKARNKFITPARAKGYDVTTVEFLISENQLRVRQRTRPDKFLSDERLRKLVQQLETPWLGVDTDAVILVTIDKEGA